VFYTKPTGVSLGSLNCLRIEAPSYCCFTKILFSYFSPPHVHLFSRLILDDNSNNMGKVHGSLARAGKVKGQTPKVEAQEDKKKLPRGRAKKRLQYNRRYVNVVTGMGGKRVGPNSNADKMK